MIRLCSPTGIFGFRKPNLRSEAYPTLTAGEFKALEHIRAEGNVRLEQERIGWESALKQLRAAARTNR